MPTNCPVDFGVSAVERKRAKALPEVLSEEEVRQLICQTKNLKHRALLKVLYTTGIRVGELVKLRPTDIDSKRMVVRVEMGKGRKSRYTVLSMSLLKELRTYVRLRSRRSLAGIPPKGIFI